MKKRLLACVLSCLLVLHLSVPALAADGLDYLEDDIGVLPADTVPEDIVVNPEDYIINSGASASSLGLTLSMGQIAALIAGGVGTVYLASNWDALGSHLQTALNEAASLNGGAAALTYWLNNARQGVIALQSAPLWITQTILNTCYSIHQGLSYPQWPLYGEYALPVPGSILPAGTPIYTTGPYINNSNGSFYRSNPYIFDFDVVPILFYYYSGTTVKYQTYAFNPNSYSIGQMSSNGGTSWYRPSNSSIYTDDATGMRRSYVPMMSAGCQLSTTAMQRAFTELIAAGGIEVASSDEMLPKLKEIISLYLAGEVIDGYGTYPDDVSVCPDALVGGISQAWTNDTLGADVIDLPDILIDGSGVITGTDTATLDTSISTTLDKVATGELAWDDYWIDIANSIPVAKVEDTTTGDVVERPISPDGTLQDPVVVPDWSTDPHDYTIDLTRFFPFCIPFDLYDFFSCLIADPEAPVFDLEIPLLGQSYGFRVDLSSFDEVAQLVRNLELFLFIIMLAVTTRDNMIKG